jgi:hypothetical protein
MNKKHSYLPVYVEWIDSTTQKKVWWSLQDLENDFKNPNIKMQTLAYLVMANKLEYIFCSSLHFEDGDCMSGGFVFSIPRGCVTKIKRIKIK